LAGKILDGGEDSSLDDFALDPREPQFHLIEPGRVGGREVEMDVRMLSQEVLYPLCLMGGQVVQDDMDLLTVRLAGNQIAEEGDEFLAGMPRRRATDDRSGLGVQRRIQRQGPVPVVLEAVSFQASR